MNQIPAIFEGLLTDADDRKYPRELPPRPANFPYDKEISYGQPANYDRGSRKGSLRNALNPGSDLTQIIPATDLGEVTGMHTNFKLSGQGSGVNGGTSSPWSTAPYLQQDRDPLDLRDAFDPAPIDVAPIPLPQSLYDVETDMELEPIDSLLLRVDEPYSLRSFLDSVGMMPKQSSWTLLQRETSVS